MYFRCNTSYNPIICRDKIALNHTKIMNLKASYWLECDCFTETRFSSLHFFVLILCFTSLCIYSCSLSIVIHQCIQLITVVFCMSIKTYLIHTTCCCCGYCCFNVKPEPRIHSQMHHYWSASNYTDGQHSQQVNHLFLKMSINYNFQMLIGFSKSFLFLV